METIQEVIELITLEKTSPNTFLGQNYKTPWGRVFGGQVFLYLFGHSAGLRTSQIIQNHVTYILRRILYDV